jgi:hypothetical protein
MARLGALGVVVLVAAVLSGCVPKFDVGAELTVSPYGMAMRVEWPAAADPDGGSIESYRIDVDGVEVARRSAAGLRRCDLAGLAAGPHEVTVTAYDAAGEWSGSAATDGTLSATVVADVVAPAGAEPGCQPMYESTVVDVGVGDVPYVAVADDGRKIAFVTKAASVPDGGGSDDNGTYDVFYRDLDSGVTTRITDGDGRSDEVAISQDGRFVAFTSQSSNLVADDTNGNGDVFLWDRDSSTTTMVSKGFAWGSGEALSMSGDGRFVGYNGPLGSMYGAYLWDRTTGATVLSSGAPGDSSEAWDVSRTGQAIVYSHTDGTDWIRQAYVWDRATGERVGIDQSVHGAWFRASDDGQVVVFQMRTVYRWDRASGVSTALGSESGQSMLPMISSDGTLVAFLSFQSDLTGAPMPAPMSLALYDARTGSTSWIAPGGPAYPRMTPDGSVIITANRSNPGIVILRRVD